MEAVVDARPLWGFLAGRRVLLTGHTGFKGSWLARWLLDAGAHVVGFALEPDTDPALFEELDLARHIDSRIGDIRDAGALAALVSLVRPEVVFHLAAQPIVRRGYAEPAYTFEVNVMGTVNLLEAVRACEDTRVVVNVTTDKVYENPESGHPFSEAEPLGGRDPYSASKACSEIVTAAYRASYFADGPAVATARAGNVIGGGDWATDRIVPDCARALLAGDPVVVRNPDSVRPWQHVLEPLSGYLALAQALWTHGARYAHAYNFGPRPGETRTVRELVERAIAAWGAGDWTAPETLAQPHEAGLLALDATKAQAELGWRPVWGFDETVVRTMDWYRRHAEGGADPQSLCEQDIAAYVTAAREQGVAWARKDDRGRQGAR